jgi:uncharacterized protein YcbK (DUF882 family)
MTLPHTLNVSIASFLRYEEVCSPDTLQAAIHVDLLIAWNTLRQALGRPIRVTSGYRTPEYNRRVVGSPKSQHMLGRALDLVWGSREMDEANYRMLLQCGFRGVGFYPFRGFIHVDVRDAPVVGWVADETGKMTTPDWMQG